MNMNPLEMIRPKRKFMGISAILLQFGNIGYGLGDIYGGGSISVIILASMNRFRTFMTMKI